MRASASFARLSAAVLVFAFLCAAPTHSRCGEPLRGAEDDTRLSADVVTAKGFVQREVTLNDEMIRAAKNGDFEEVKKKVGKGADVNAFYTKIIDCLPGETALMYAALNGHNEIVRYLISNGADVNAVCGNGATAVFNAALSDNAEAIKLLIGKKADPNVLHENGYSPLAVAAIFGNGEAVLALAGGGADVNAAVAERVEIHSFLVVMANLSRRVHLMKAAMAATSPLRKQWKEEEYWRTVKLAARGQEEALGELAVVLVKAFPNFSDFDFKLVDRMTPLMFLAIRGDAAGAEALVRRGADMNAEDRHGFTALAYSVMYVSSGVEKALTGGGKAELGGRTVEVLVGKQCGGCGKAVSILTDLGGKCPHCGAKFGVGLESFKKDPPPAPPGSEAAIAPSKDKLEGKRCKKCEKEVPLASKAGDSCPHCQAVWGTELVSVDAKKPGR